MAGENIDVESDLNGRAAALIEQLSQDDAGAEPGSDAGELEAAPPAGAPEGGEPEASGTDSAPAAPPIDRVAEIEAQAAAERARRLARQERHDLDRKRQSFDQERQQLQQQAERAKQYEASWNDKHAIAERLFELEPDNEALGELLTSYADGAKRAEMQAKRAAKTSTDEVAQLRAELKAEKESSERARLRAEGEQAAEKTALDNTEAVPRAAALAKRSPARFRKLLHEHADAVRADPRLQRTGTFLHNVLYSIEEELEELFGSQSSGTAAPSTSPSAAANGAGKPRVIGNRAAAERGTLLNPDEEDLPFDERVRRLEQRVRSR